MSLLLRCPSVEDPQGIFSLLAPCISAKSPATRPLPISDLGSLLEGTGRIRVGDETLTVPRHGGVLVGPDQLRQVFNDIDAEVLWLIIGAPEELELLQGSKSLMELSLIYPVDPKQLPKELAGSQWPPK